MTTEDLFNKIDIKENVPKEGKEHFDESAKSLIEPAGSKIRKFLEEGGTATGFKDKEGYHVRAERITDDSASVISESIQYSRK